MPVTLKNTGNADATNVIARIMIKDSCVNITDNEVVWGDIAAGKSRKALDFDFEVSDTCLVGHVINFTLNISSNEGSWSDHISITVVAKQEPILEYYDHIIDDNTAGGSIGNGNKEVNSGETIELPLKLKNRGDSDAHNITATISALDKCINITDDDITWVSIAAGEIKVSYDFDFKVSNYCPDGHTINFTLDITSDEGSWSDSFSLNVVKRLSNDSDNDFIPDLVEMYLGMDSGDDDKDGDGVLDGVQTTGEHGDNFFDSQWHIRSIGENANPDPDSTTVAGNDLGLMDVYHTYMGYNRGNRLLVQVVDTGVDADHEDLIDNMDLTLSRNSITQAMGDPVEVDDSSHGTMCAGILASRAFNGKGVRGVVPFAKIAGSNWMNEQSEAELEEVWTKNDPNGKIILASNSWGNNSAMDSTYKEDLMEFASSNLRKVNGVAKGKIFVKAAGNSREDRCDVNLDYSRANPYVITVASLKSNNTHSIYSTSGSNVFVSGYSGNYYWNSATIGTTYIAGRSALRENLTYNNVRKCLERDSDSECSMPTWQADVDADKSYTYAMNGTSAATPMVAGSIALLLEACPTLPWRDVKYLIAKHATKVNNVNATWVTNAAGFHHSVDYGFGLINTADMIAECKTGYTELPSAGTYSQHFNINPDIAIPDNDVDGITYDFRIQEDKTIEWIGITITSEHTYSGDLEIHLTSPSGTISRIMLGRSCAKDYSMSSGYRYGSVAFYGESSVGIWSIKIADIQSGDTGKLEHLIFTVFGY